MTELPHVIPSHDQPRYISRACDPNIAFLIDFEPCRERTCTSSERYVRLMSASVHIDFFLDQTSGALRGVSVVINRAIRVRNNTTLSTPLTSPFAARLAYETTQLKEHEVGIQHELPMTVYLAEDTCLIQIGATVPVFTSYEGNVFGILTDHSLNLAGFIFPAITAHEMSAITQHVDIGHDDVFERKTMQSICASEIIDHVKQHLLWQLLLFGITRKIVPAATGIEIAVTLLTTRKVDNDLITELAGLSLTDDKQAQMIITKLAAQEETTEESTLNQLWFYLLMRRKQTQNIV